MEAVKHIALGIAGILVVSAFAAVAFVYSGVYNIGADDHHTKPVLAMIETMRERSISVRAESITVPKLDDPAQIAAGAIRYSMLCVGCHLAPGVDKSELRSGLYPHPPNLAQADVQDPRKAFWTIKHGIKMSAMPAWGKSLDDAAIWELVAFVRQMPSLSPEAYQQPSRSRPE
jgi:mono/diheme cytochrome c family protein